MSQIGAAVDVRGLVLEISAIHVSGEVTATYFNKLTRTNWNTRTKTGNKIRVLSKGVVLYK